MITLLSAVLAALYVSSVPFSSVRAVSASVIALFKVSFVPVGHCPGASPSVISSYNAFASLISPSRSAFTVSLERTASSSTFNSLPDAVHGLEMVVST